MICQTDGKDQLLIRAEPMTGFGIRREGIRGRGSVSESTWYENCVVVLCTSRWEFFKQVHMVVATSFGYGGRVGGLARARISHSRYWVGLRRRALKLSFQAQKKPSIWPPLKLRASLLSSLSADWASWSRSNSINRVNPCHLRVLHFLSCLT